MSKEQARRWLIDYQNAKRACMLKIGAEYFIDRLSGIEDKEIIAKFKSTIVKNRRIKINIRLAAAEFEKWVALSGKKNKTSSSTTILTEELSKFLSYNYSYLKDIPILSHIVLQQMLVLQKYFKNNFQDLPVEIKPSSIAYFLKLNLEQFDGLDWLMYLIFYFEKNNKKERINISSDERKTLLTFYRIIKNESSYNQGNTSNPYHLITRKGFKITNIPGELGTYLKKYTKKGVLKKICTKKKGEDQEIHEQGYLNDKKPINVLTFLSNNFDNLINIFSKMSNRKRCFSKKATMLILKIEVKRKNIARLSKLLLSVGDHKI